MDLFVVIGLDAVNFTLTIILVAMGLVIIFGLMNVINFAHGELFLLGAYTVVVVEMLGGGFWLGLVLAPLVVGAIGLVFEELVIRHIYHRFLDTILATWGLSIAIKQVIIITFGPVSYHVSETLPFTVDVLGVTYPAYRLFIMGVSVVVIFFVIALFFGTKFGLSARAVIANRRMSSCLGINTRRLDRATFAIGAALAGLAGAVMTPLISVEPQMGLGFLIPAFLAILVGGAGNLVGVLAGASIVGITDTAIAAIWSPVVAQIIVFSLAIVVIRLFPRGVTSWRFGK